MQESSANSNLVLHLSITAILLFFGGETLWSQKLYIRGEKNSQQRNKATKGQKRTKEKGGQTREQGLTPIRGGTQRPRNPTTCNLTLSKSKLHLLKILHFISALSCSATDASIAGHLMTVNEPMVTGNYREPLYKLAHMVKGQQNMVPPYIVVRIIETIHAYGYFSIK